MYDNSTHPTLQRVILQRDLPKYDGLQETRRDELIAQGKYPPPVKLSNRRKGWLESEIAEWQQARISERDSATAPRSSKDLLPVVEHPAHSTPKPRMARWKPGSTEGSGATRPESERVTINSPSAVWRVSKCLDRGIGAKSKIISYAQATAKSPAKALAAGLDFQDDDETRQNWRETAERDGYEVVEDDAPQAKRYWQGNVIKNANKAVGLAQLDYALPDEPPEPGTVDAVRRVVEVWKSLLNKLLASTAPAVAAE